MQLGSQGASYASQLLRRNRLLPAPRPTPERGLGKRRGPRRASPGPGRPLLAPSGRKGFPFLRVRNAGGAHPQAPSCFQNLLNTSPASPVGGFTSDQRDGKEGPRTGMAAPQDPRQPAQVRQVRLRDAGRRAGREPPRAAAR